MSPILNPLFEYKNASKTDVMETWRRFGFRPTTEQQRKEAQERLHNRTTGEHSRVNDAG